MPGYSSSVTELCTNSYAMSVSIICSLRTHDFDVCYLLLTRATELTDALFSHTKRPCLEGKDLNIDTAYNARTARVCLLCALTSPNENLSKRKIITPHSSQTCLCSLLVCNMSKTHNLPSFCPYAAKIYPGVSQYT